MTDFTGKYKQTSAENLEALFKEIGAPQEVVDRLKSSISELEVTKAGSEYTVKMITPDRTRETKFELGKEFEGPRFGGPVVKSVVVADGNKLIETIKGEKEIKIVRELNGNQLRVSTTVGPVVGVITYARQ
ncbi:unnamed protein product [Oppiella nova]|uniref:Uncharacterized protein n=1 Tax=Oppiella nova TaxID=334625 RepID=A0A7R9QW69_9ACAR|nr:unnamed protein product [Oppiella nova]CAG2177836.1 unnamed protein product [Oppiella nova]